MVDENLNNKFETYINDLLISAEQDVFASTSIIPRSSYITFYQSFSNLRNYLHKTKFIEYFQRKLRSINPSIYNPYPIMYNDIQYFTFIVPEHLTLNGNLPQPTTVKYLYKQSLLSNENNKDNNIFGLSFVIQNCDPYYLITTKNIANKIIPDSVKTFTLRSPVNNTLLISIQSILSLTDKSIFLGAIIPDVECFDFRLDFLMTVSPAQLQMAGGLFFDAINYHLDVMKNLCRAIVLAITSEQPQEKTTASVGKAASQKYFVWLYNDWMNTNLPARNFVNKLAESEMSQSSTKSGNISFISVDLLIPNDNMVSVFNGDIYHKVRIQYVPIFLQRKESINGKETWSCFGNNENSLAHHMFEDIFFNQETAEVFMTLISRNLPVSGKNGQELSDKFSVRNSSNEIDLMISQNKPRKVSEMKNVFGMFKFPDSDQIDSKKVSLENEDYVSMAKTRDPFWINYGTFIQDYWIKEIVNSQMMINFFQILDNILRLVLIKSDLLPKEMDYEAVKREIVFVYNSFAYKLHNIIQMNKTLRQLIYSFGEHSQTEITIRIYQIFFKILQELLFNIRSSNVLSFNNSLIEYMESRIKEFVNRNKNIINIELMLELRYYNNICYYLLWQFISSILMSCRELFTLINYILSTYSKDDHKDQVLLKSFEFSKEVDFLNFTKATVASDNSGESKEADVIEYLERKNFRNYWAQFVSEIVSKDSSNILSNPFFVLSNQFHLASIKMDIDSVSIKNLNTSEVSFELLDGTYNLYKIKDYEAYGLKSSLCLFDVNAITKLDWIIQLLDRKLFNKKEGAFKIFISTGLVGSLLYHGLIDPHIRLIEFVDNIFVFGPQGCIQEASQLFAKTVIDNLMEIHQQSSNNKCICFGIYLSDSNLKWSMEDINNNPRECMIQSAKHCLKKSIYTRLFFRSAWRYVPVIKYFRFYFIVEETQNYYKLNSNDDELIDSYQMVFFSRKNADIYFNFSGITRGLEYFNDQIRVLKLNKIVEQRIEFHFENGDWMQYYHMILYKSMIIGNLEIVQIISKIFHSSFGHLNYLNILNKTIQFVMFSVMESRNFSRINSKESEANKNISQPKEDQVLTNTFRLYYHIISTLKANRNLAHIQILDQILSCLNEICSFRSATQSVDIIPNQENIQKMEELRQIVSILELIYGQSSSNFLK